MLDKIVYKAAVSLDGMRVDLKVSLKIATSASSMDVQSAALPVEETAVETVGTQAEVKAEWTAVFVAAWWVEKMVVGQGITLAGW